MVRLRGGMSSLADTLAILTPPPPHRLRTDERFARRAACRRRLEFGKG
jgi:hypothetical protein